MLLLALLAPFLARAERSALGLLCVLLGAATLVLQWQQPEMLLADPGHRLHHLARANIETVPAAQLRQLETDLPASRERDVVLGLQAARRQQWHESHQRYVQALAQDSTWATTYVNLANLFFVLTDYTRAATGYRTAQSLAPGNPTPHANLAQAYIQMLQYEQSDHELRMASSLGFNAMDPARFAWEHESQPVVAALLTRHDLRHLAERAVDEDPDAARLRLAAWIGPGWNGLRLEWMPWFVLTMAVWFLLRVRWSQIAFECAECKRLTCRHCVPAGDDAGRFCPRCEAIASRRIGSSIGDGTPASRRPSHAKTADKAPDGIALVFPGAAYFLLHAPGRAIGTVVLACATLSFSLPWLSGATFLSLYLPGLLQLRNKPRTAGV
jgi:tetratricopeptide (TPR) repeat protein